MSKDKILYQGKAKTIIKGPKKHTLIQRFKDDATAYNKKKHKIFKGKGILNNKISEYLMTPPTVGANPNVIYKTY
jgi:phosphoribosylaminoimidazole-succinocarboxamide synthase